MATFIDCPGGGQISVPGGRIPPDWLQQCGRRSSGGGPPMTNVALKQFSGFRAGPGLGFPPISGPGDPGGTNPIPGDLGELGREIGGGLGGDTGASIGGLFGKLLGRTLGFNGQQQPVGCPPGHERRNGKCVETGIRGGIERVLPFGQTGTLEDTMGDPVNGRFGVGIVPAQRTTSVLDCPRGMVLGKDNVCYERLRKSERKWPPGRKPLLTGGEMNAITTASRVAKKLNRTKKKLRGVKNALKKVT